MAKQVLCAFGQEAGGSQPTPASSSASNPSKVAREAAVAAAADTSQTKFQGLGILKSVSDLPKMEALGIELRKTSILAGPIKVADGSFSAEPFRIRYELGSDVEANKATLCETLVEVLDHFKWKGVTGCSVTIELCKKIGMVEKYFSSMEEKVGEWLRSCLRRRVSFVHTVIHTTAAGYNELVWGRGSDPAFWEGKVVLVCTIGRHLGAIIFNDGCRVRTSQLNKVFTPEWQARMEEASFFQPSDAQKFAPPAEDDPQYQEWVTMVDLQLSAIVDLERNIDQLILLPVGRTAQRTKKELTASLLPRLVKTKTEADKHGCTLTILQQGEGELVRGAAVCALKELQTTQLLGLLKPVIEGRDYLQALSMPQLRAIFDHIDSGGTGSIKPDVLKEGLELLGIGRDVEILLKEVDTSEDGTVSFPEFIQWWTQHVKDARVITTTSIEAWNRILHAPPPPGFGNLVVLEITFTFCRSCKAFEPKFRRLANQHPEVRFVQLVGNSTVGAMDLCTKTLQVKVSPCFLIFRRGGEQLARWTGANVERFEKHLHECLEAEAALSAPSGEPEQ